MYNAFKEAGQNVKILLHQDGHLTPTYPAGNYVFDIGDSSYDEILNRWFSHYLYGVENGAENMAAVTAQDSHDTNVWNTYDSWEAAKNVVFSIDTDSETTTTITAIMPILASTLPTGRASSLPAPRGAALCMPRL